MGFILKNTSGLINTRLTDTGRLKLSKGNFNISYFQVGDSEVSYTLAGTSYNQSDTNILEPNFNSQNSSGIPQSNKQYIKYPYYVDGSDGNTYGIPYLASVVQPVFNRAALRGFFSGNTTADTINWSALTNNQYAINSNYVIDMSTLNGSNLITVSFSGCNTDIVRLPMIGDIITIFYDGNGKINCDCSDYPTPTPTPTPSSIPIDYQIYYMTDCCGEKADGYMSLPNTYNSWDIVGATNNSCYTVNYPLEGTPTLVWDTMYYGNGDCTSCNLVYPCGVTPTPTPSSGFACDPPVTPTPSSTFCVTQEPYYCPPPPPVNCEMNVTNCYTILTYKIVDVCGLTITLDRETPDFSMFSNCCYARTIVYPPNMSTIYDSVTPMPHWKEDVINFESVCDRDQFDVKIWNMNIPWSENPAGLYTNINVDYLNYGSVSYIGTKEYYGYMSDSGQTDSSFVFYYNSFGEIINVKPKEQKSIAIVHYTNNSIDFFYGEKFALEPYDESNPDDTTGEARNFRIHIPTLMWHKNPECGYGQTFYVDPPGFDKTLELFQPHYLTSNENSDMNNPVGLRYYHLWDTNPNSNNFGKPNRIGKVFPDDQIIVIDDEEIIAAMSYKSNRNWTLPAPKIGLITPNTCGSNGETTIGLLTASTEFLYVTYRFTNENSFTNSLHCNYYSKIQGPDLSCNPTSKQNVSIRFGAEFPFLNQIPELSPSPPSCDLKSGFFGEKLEIICQKVTGDTRPESSEWKIIDVTPQISGNSINNYITQSGITGNTFVISETDYEQAPYYNLGNNVTNPLIDIYGLSIPLIGQTGTTLNFGDEYYFYGSLETDIQATIYEMRYKINLGQAEFQSTSNPSWVDTTPSYISEIGLYDSDMNLMIVSKLQSPVLRQGIQQFLVKFDF